MKLSPALFYSVAVGLSSALTAALMSGAVPAEWVPYVAGVSTLLAALVQRTTPKPTAPSVP